LDKIADWGLNKLKELVINGIKSGMEKGAEEGLMYVLHQVGLIGPPVEEMLIEIQTSINRFDAKLDQLGRCLLKKGWKAV
jgi:hypothetical protein